jgi:hypothetical protein
MHLNQKLYDETINGRMKSGDVQFGPEPGNKTEKKEIAQDDTLFWLTTYAPKDKEKL